MILQLKNYPISVDGYGKLATEQSDLLNAATLIRWILLNESDWTQLPDSPISLAGKEQWVVYRQYLRDLPNNFPEVFEDTLEILDPPSEGCPASWVNLSPQIESE